MDTGNLLEFLNIDGSEENRDLYKRLPEGVLNIKTILEFTNDADNPIEN